MVLLASKRLDGGHSVSAIAEGVWEGVNEVSATLDTEVKDLVRNNVEGRVTGRVVVTA